MPRGIKNKVSERQFEEMKEFYADNHTLRELSDKYGLGYGYLRDQFKLRGWLRGKGVRVKPLPVQSLDDTSLVQFKSEWDRLDTTTKGSIAEGYARIRLSELGYDVWEPATQNHRTDLVVLFGREVVKIQVKAATYDIPSKSFRGNLTRHHRKGDYSAYAEEDVDFFIVYCGGLPNLEFYVIPASLASENRTPRFFPHRERALTFRDFNWETYRNAFHLIKPSSAL